MNRRPPDGLYCPVCGKPLVFIWVWMDPTSSRIRMFCEDCSHLDGYHGLPKSQRAIFSLEGFERFAGRRLLAHVRERELAKQGGAAEQHADGTEGGGADR